MDKPVFRKPRTYFETDTRPNHVTFDDGKTLKRNCPWAHYIEARWDYAEPDTIKIILGDWLIIVTGYNLEPLYAVLENRTLSRLRAHPEFEENADHTDDSFVTEIRFMSAPARAKKTGQSEFDLFDFS